MGAWLVDEGCWQSTHLGILKQPWEGKVLSWNTGKYYASPCILTFKMHLFLCWKARHLARQDKCHKSHPFNLGLKVHGMFWLFDFIRAMSGAERYCGGGGWSYWFHVQFLGVVSNSIFICQELVRLLSWTEEMFPKINVLTLSKTHPICPQCLCIFFLFLQARKTIKAIHYQYQWTSIHIS